MFGEAARATVPFGAGPRLCARIVIYLIGREARVTGGSGSSEYGPAPVAQGCAAGVDRHRHTGDGAAYFDAALPAPTVAGNAGHPFLDLPANRNQHQRRLWSRGPCSFARWPPPPLPRGGCGSEEPALVA